MMHGVCVVLFLAVAVLREAAAGLSCPTKSTQVGTTSSGNDISGCGLEDCDDRYQDSYNSITACQTGCIDDIDCVAFSWCPKSGDQNHAGKKVCTLYSSTVPTSDWGPKQIFCVPAIISCPGSASQQGTLNTGNDIGGCGLDGCDARYGYANIQACSRACKQNSNCVAFSWTPTSGDKNHAGKKVCTLYDSVTPTGDWGPRQIFCVPSSSVDDEVFLFGAAGSRLLPMANLGDSVQLVVLVLALVAVWAAWWLYGRCSDRGEYKPLMEERSARAARV